MNAVLVAFLQNIDEGASRLLASSIGLGHRPISLNLALISLGNATCNAHINPDLKTNKNLSNSNLPFITQPVANLICTDSIVMYYLKCKKLPCSVRK